MLSLHMLFYSIILSEEETDAFPAYFDYYTETLKLILIQKSCNFRGILKTTV